MLIRDENGNLHKVKGETEKSHARRVREGWFDKYAPADKPGLDIGCRNDPLNWTFRRWEIQFGDGDGAALEGVPSETYDTVYASHVLEHLPYHRQALRRWYEVLKYEGHLIVCVPHRDLYEKKKSLPSYWNDEHCRFWLPDDEQPPGTLCLKKEMLLALPNADIVSYRVLDEGYCDNSKPGPDGNEFFGHNHPCGEYAIEMIVKKH